MRLPRFARSDKANEKGVTLIELLLVIAITTIVGATSVSVGSSFLTRNNFRNKTNEVVSSLRIARVNALSGKENSSWGVNITSSNIIMFKGTSYATRDTDFDQSFSIPASVSITTDEIIFSQVTGNPDATASLTISIAGDSSTVAVNEVGVVDVN